MADMLQNADLDAPDSTSSLTTTTAAGSIHPIQPKSKITFEIQNRHPRLRRRRVCPLIQPAGRETLLQMFDLQGPVRDIPATAKSFLKVLGDPRVALLVCATRVYSGVASRAHFSHHGHVATVLAAAVGAVAVRAVLAVAVALL